jgi:hypothetical protein
LEERHEPLRCCHAEDGGYFKLSKKNLRNLVVSSSYPTSTTAFVRTLKNHQIPSKTHPEMDLQDKFNRLTELKRYSIPAKRLKEHLSPILSKSDELQKRWIWELLQNASDLGDEIKVEIKVDKEKVVFRHNGPPFSLEEAYNLIMPDSGKDEDEPQKEKSTIGQFGTGFISTHILSSYIEVKGVIEDDEYFKFAFALDRKEREDKEFLIKSIMESEEEYRTGLVHFPDYELGQRMDTEFTYYLEDTYNPVIGSEVLNLGLEFFDEIIQFVLAFRYQLSEIKITDRRSLLKKIKVYSWEEIETSIENLILVKITCKKNGIENWSRIVGLVSQEKTTIAFLLEHENSEQYRFLPFPENCPRLFCAFPMIGSEYFTFPVIVHSEDFVPAKERDGISLSNNDFENRKRLLEAKQAFDRVLKIAEDYEWLDVFHICDLKPPAVFDATIRDWLKVNIFEPVAKSIREAKIVELDESLELEDHRRSLSVMVIPYVDRRLSDKHELVQKIHELVFELSPELVPRSEHCLFWYEYINFDFFEGEKLDLKVLMGLASEKVDNLENFRENHSFEKGEEIEWLKKLIQFAQEQEELSFFEEYHLLPNQNGDFKPRKKLYWDNIFHEHLREGYDEMLKDIYAEIAPPNDYRSDLLHLDFVGIANLLDEDKELSLENLALDVDNAFKEYDGDMQEEASLKVLQKMFSWYAHSGLSEDILKKLFPWFSEKRSQLYMETQTPEQRDLAFDIVRSGKTEGLAALAKSDFTNEELIAIAENQQLLNDFFYWLNSKVQDNPDKELGDIGEEFVYHTLCRIFGDDNVLWEDKAEYDFKVLNTDKSTRFFIDAKTTGHGISNSDNVPFFMRYPQWVFLAKEEAKEKYLLARVFKQNGRFDIKFLKMGLEEGMSR